MEHYKREKNKVEIEGDRWLARFDLISLRIIWAAVIIFLIIKVPQISWLPIVLDWLKKIFPVLLFFVMVAVQLSG